MARPTPTDKDEALIALLKANAREPVASLARKLGLSRTTVQDRLRRLEETGVIAGYDVRLAGNRPEGIRALVTLSVEPRLTVEVTAALRRFPEIETLMSVSGKYDMVAMIRVADAGAVDRVLDRIGVTRGVLRTESHIILSTKLDRR
ncbi:MAG: Lrp/AsnC family transcriptional regulator [Hyphomicrobiaceae bacterium]